MTKTEMLEKLRERATILHITPGIEDIVIRIYMEDEVYEEFMKWIKNSRRSK